MRDLTKVLSESEAIKLRALLAQMPETQAPANGSQEYPKMLYHPDYLDLSRVAHHHPDPLTRKEALQKMSRVLIVVHDIETEEEYLADGWKGDPVQIMVERGEKDPRIPTGREGRRSEAQKRQSVEDELREIRRRYAALTGQRLVDAPVETAPAASEDLEDAPATVPVRMRPVAPKRAVAAPLPDKRAQVQAAARRSAQPRA